MSERKEMGDMRVTRLGGVYIASYELGFVMERYITGIGKTQESAIADLHTNFDKFYSWHGEYVKNGCKP